MLKLLLLPGGVNRVLHSAAAHKWRKKLQGKKKEVFEKAYRYMSKRMKYLRYAQYRAQGMPIGSGVTEAACKTLVKQRLCCSGMRWTPQGAQIILSLRALVLTDTRWGQFWQKINQYGVPSIS